MKYHIELDIDFRRNFYPGKYIVIEGIDGSGKTTQTNLLCKYLEKQKIKHICTAEPRKEKGVVGKLIHQILDAKTKIPPVAFQYLFSAERSIHHEELIIPSLKNGKWVVSDRSFWSAIPYGIMDKIMNDEKKDYDFSEGKVILAAQSILSMYHQFLVPDITFYLDISVSTAMKRISGKQQKEIYEKKEKLDKIVKGYRWLAKEFPKEITIINGEGSVDKVHKEIIKKIEIF
ncbi:MAG: dTMP kinase [Patescibacteria group bacterium]|nr:dTMP kinase [Patescibacteria group bacterium]